MKWVRNFTYNPVNLLDAVEDVLAACHSQHAAALQVSRRRDGPDLDLIGRYPGWQDSGAGRAVLDALSARRDVARVQRVRGDLRIWLASEWIESIGVELEQGLGEALAVKDLAAGWRLVVDYCDPNATKALHLGHLRNIALGHALASVAAHGGADVVRECQVGDIG